MTQNMSTVTLRTRELVSSQGKKMQVCFFFSNSSHMPMFFIRAEKTLRKNACNCFRFGQVSKKKNIDDDK